MNLPHPHTPQRACRAWSMVIVRMKRSETTHVTPSAVKPCPEFGQSERPCWTPEAFTGAEGALRNGVVRLVRRRCGGFGEDAGWDFEPPGRRRAQGAEEMSRRALGLPRARAFLFMHEADGYQISRQRSKSWRGSTPMLFFACGTRRAARGRAGGSVVSAPCLPKHAFATVPSRALVRSSCCCLAPANRASRRSSSR